MLQTLKINNLNKLAGFSFYYSHKRAQNARSLNFASAPHLQNRCLTLMFDDIMLTALKKSCFWYELSFRKQQRIPQALEPIEYWVFNYNNI